MIDTRIAVKYHAYMINDYFDKPMTRLLSPCHMPHPKPAMRVERGMALPQWNADRYGFIGFASGRPMS